MARRAPPLALVVLLALAACSPSETTRKANRDEIAAALEGYLPVLGQVYATGQAEDLEGLAAEKEISRIRRRLDELASQGRTLVPTFHQLTVEEVDVWNWSNAFVTTVEVWDVQIMASGTDTVLSQEMGQSNRVKYQLKREGQAGWKVLFRTIVE